MWPRHVEFDPRKKHSLRDLSGRFFPLRAVSVLALHFYVSTCPLLHGCLVTNLQSLHHRPCTSSVTPVAFLNATTALSLKTVRRSRVKSFLEAIKLGVPSAWSSLRSYGRIEVSFIESNRLLKFGSKLTSLSDSSPPSSSISSTASRVSDSSSISTTGALSLPFFLFDEAASPVFSMLLVFCFFLVLRGATSSASSASSASFSSRSFPPPLSPVSSACRFVPFEVPGFDFDCLFDCVFGAGFVMRDEVPRAISNVRIQYFCFNYLVFNLSRYLARTPSATCCRLVFYIVYVL
jgi:hypothetical protein